MSKTSPTQKAKTKKSPDALANPFFDVFTITFSAPDSDATVVDRLQMIALAQGWVLRTVRRGGYAGAALWPESMVGR
jgi:hypothetical protein